MKNLKIRVKLLGSFIIVVVLAVVIGLVGIFSLTSAADNTALLSDRTTIAIVAARLNRNVQAQRAAFRGAAIYHVMNMPEKRDVDLNAVSTLISDFETQFDSIADSFATEDGRRLHEEIGNAYVPFAAARDVFLQSITDPNVSNEEMVANLDNVAASVAVLAESVAALVDFMDVMTNEQAADAAATAASTTIVLVAILVAVAIFSIILALYISSLISKPLAAMQAVLVQVGQTGNMNFTDETKEQLRKEAGHKDEIGQSINAFVAMMDRLVYVGDRLGEVAGGDLTADISLLGPNDTMGNALVSMNSNLNEMFSEINSVAQQVTTASTEIAQGAQSLAQGSTEQASTVEEISASINEITQQADVSVKTANDAARDSQNIRNIAQDGNDKMNRLSTAVQEMSDASQAIGNVIKAIDDIAFQTNILALNAAVEAARAGEHGKGFAVVADEVRNLAGKSSEAAKDTASLISANIEKSELGLTISRETAETLQQIVAGVENTTESLNTIAQQSEGSKAATEQVNLAVDQVAQVVQQNSATSEESAAASEEMSSQAQVLQQLIARFKLKGSASAAGQPRLLAHASTSAVEDAAAVGGNIIF